jgi:hypothetical protein
MARLPVPGSDDGTWGQILNDFLVVAHNSDGTSKDIAQSQVTGLTSDLSNKVSVSRAINSGTGLSGGGDLSADRTLAVLDDSTTQRVQVEQSGSLISTRKKLNFINGSNVTISVADDAANNRVNVTVTAAQPVASGLPTPEDQGLLTWAFDPVHAVSFTATASGVLSLTKVWLRQSVMVTNVLYAVAIAGTGLTAGQNFLGLYDSTGTRVALTADQTGNMGGTGLITAAFTSPYVASAGFYWVGILTNASGSSPQLARAGALAVSNLASAGTSVATRRYGSVGSGQTGLPASFIPSSITAITNGTFWVALS